MLIDKALDSKYKRMLDRQHYKHITRLRPQIKRFIFDADASHKIGRFSVNQTALVCQYGIDITPPLPNTYIEIDQHACITGAGNNPGPDASPRLGFLFVEKDKAIYTLAGDDTDAYFEPFIMRKGGPRLDKNIDYDDISLNPKVSRKDYDIIKYILMIGQTGEADNLWPYSKPFIDTYELELTNNEIHPKLLGDMTVEGVGVFKRAVTALMLLSERIGPKYQHVTASRQFLGSRLTAIPAHSIVTIDLDDDRIRNIYHGFSPAMTSRALHDVAEHWVTYDLSSQCRHQWQTLRSEKLEEIDIEKFGNIRPRQICMLCGGRRTKRRVHERGDRSKPKIVKTYKIKASKEKGK